MTKLRNCALGWGLLGVLAASCPVLAAASEWNPVRTHAVEIGAQASRLIVGFKATQSNSVSKSIKRSGRGDVLLRQAMTSAADVTALAQRRDLAVRGSHQMTPSMHVVLLSNTLYGEAVEAVLTRLRADPAVAFADVDQRRQLHEIPNDPLFQPASESSGQWYMLAPSSATPASDFAAIDAVSAWNLSTGSSGTVIADVDSGVRFDHPDLLRAGFGGRLLPGYDFVGADYDLTTGAALNSYLVANDGDGWDPDPSDPGDWIASTDQINTQLFPSAKCPVADSTWHGTRVVGLLGAVTNNATGIAGVTWSPYILPVRALGKCGGYDSDIIAAMQWAAGLAVSGVVDNPYPANIINMSLGGAGTCLSDYQAVINTLNSMGILIVVSAGNASGPVDSPGNCRGVMTVAGLRNVGTKVGYSSFGAEVGVSAPAGNCINSSGACLRSIDTTTNAGLTAPTTSTYTNEINPNLGTSFSAPLVAGIAALMHALNGNLTPAQLIARIEASATPFPPNTSALPVCPATDSSTGQCACVIGQCGAGMVNAYKALQAAQDPIAAVVVPPAPNAGNLLFDGSGSAAACDLRIASYAWNASGGVTIESGQNQPRVQVTWSGSAGALTLMVTDSAGQTDTATVVFSTTGAASSAPVNAGSSATACPTPNTFAVQPPTVTPAFSPVNIASNGSALLTLTLSNPNPFALTQSSYVQNVPANLSVTATPAATTTCSGAALALTSKSNVVTLSNAVIPAASSCFVSFNVKAAAAGSYTAQATAQSLVTAPAGSNINEASTTLNVTAPSSAGGGGGALTWLDVFFSASLLLWGHARVRGRA